MVVNELRYKTNIRNSLVIQSLGLLCLSVVKYCLGSGYCFHGMDIVLSGSMRVAKDFTKTASKSAIKLTSDKLDGFESKDSRLFRWVAWFTGSKKCDERHRFFRWWFTTYSFWVSKFTMVNGFPDSFNFHIHHGTVTRNVWKEKRIKNNKKFFFSKNKVVNNLALIRIFLFGARDVWFVVVPPVFLYSSGWTFIQVSGLMAFWTIFYGFIQVGCSKIIPETESRVIGKRLRNWMFGLCVIPAILYFM